MGERKERRPSGRPRRTWEVNIELDHKDMGWEAVVDLYCSGWEQLAGFREDGNETSDCTQHGEFLD